MSSFDIISGRDNFACVTPKASAPKREPRATNTFSSVVFTSPQTANCLLAKPMRQAVPTRIPDNDVFLTSPPTSPLPAHSRKKAAVVADNSAGLLIHLASPRGRQKTRTPGVKGQEITPKVSLKRVEGKHMLDTNSPVPYGGRTIPKDIHEAARKNPPFDPPSYKFIGSVKTHRPLVHPGTPQPKSEERGHVSSFKNPTPSTKSSVEYSITSHTEDIVNMPVSPSKHPAGQFAPWEREIKCSTPSKNFRRSSETPEQKPNQGRKPSEYSSLEKRSYAITSHSPHVKTPRSHTPLVIVSPVAHQAHRKSDSPANAKGERRVRKKDTTFINPRPDLGVMMSPRNVRSPGESQRRRPQKRHYDNPPEKTNYVSENRAQLDVITESSMHSSPSLTPFSTDRDPTTVERKVNPELNALGAQGARVLSSRKHVPEPAHVVSSHGGKKHVVAKPAAAPVASGKRLVQEPVVEQ